jgi:hypothetical protein
MTIYHFILLALGKSEERYREIFFFSSLLFYHSRLTFFPAPLPPPPTSLPTLSAGAKHPFQLFKHLFKEVKENVHDVVNLMLDM